MGSRCEQIGHTCQVDVVSGRGGAKGTRRRRSGVWRVEAAVDTCIAGNEKHNRLLALRVLPLIWALEFKRRNGSYVGKAGQGHGDVRMECTDLPERVADPCQSQRLQPLGPLAPAWERIPPIGSRTGVTLRSSLKAAEQRDEAFRERLMRGLGERHHVSF